MKKGKILRSAESYEGGNEAHPETQSETLPVMPDVLPLVAATFIQGLIWIKLSEKGVEM